MAKGDLKAYLRRQSTTFLIEHREMFKENARVNADVATAQAAVKKELRHRARYSASFFKRMEDEAND